MLRCILCISMLSLFACQQTKKDAVPQPVTDSMATSNIDDILLNSTYNTTQLQGIYTGQFDGSPISIAVNYISGKNVSGYNVHKGLKRNVHGTLEPLGRQFKLMLDQPGDNKYDGHFDLFIDTASFTGQGTWTPKNDSTLKKKNFTLVRKKEDDYNQLASSWTDTLSRTIQLKDDGAAVFSYYNYKGTPQEQLETIMGSWQQKKDSVILFWQPNTIFPSRHSSFYILKEHGDNDTTSYVSGLRGENADWINEAP